MKLSELHNTHTHRGGGAATKMKKEMWVERELAGKRRSSMEGEREKKKS